MELVEEVPFTELGDGKWRDQCVVDERKLEVGWTTSKREDSIAQCRLARSD